jgi:hypothetical protein
VDADRLARAQETLRIQADKLARAQEAGRIQADLLAQAAETQRIRADALDVQRAEAGRLAGVQETGRVDADRLARAQETLRLQVKYADRANVSYPPEEWARIEQLEERFPNLEKARLRPESRARTGDEHVFEERMQTTQGNYSLAAYNDKGVKVIQFDNITPQGWIEEIKIQQTDAERVVAQLRRQADFAEDYGLQGVLYSVDPPNIAKEVEQLVAESGMRSVFRVT